MYMSKGTSNYKTPSDKMYHSCYNQPTKENGQTGKTNSHTIYPIAVSLRLRYLLTEQSSSWLYSTSYFYRPSILLWLVYLSNITTCHYRTVPHSGTLLWNQNQGSIASTATILSITYALVSGTLWVMNRKLSLHTKSIDFSSYDLAGGTSVLMGRRCKGTDLYKEDWEHTLFWKMVVRSRTLLFAIWCIHDPSFYKVLLLSSVSTSEQELYAGSIWWTERV